jgi:hypothetical protein
VATKSEVRCLHLETRRATRWTDAEVVELTTPLLHRIARIFGSLIAVVLAPILVLGMFGPGPPPDVAKAPPYTQLGLTMLTVALGVQLVGLVIALRWEPVGGSLAVLGYLLKQATLAVDGDVPFLVFASDIWLWPAVAGLLYLACWWRNRRRGELAWLGLARNSPGRGRG